MFVQHASKVHITGDKRVSLLKSRWRECTEPVSKPRSDFETILAVCGALSDPEFHDGWQPVRARSAAEQEATKP